MSGWTAGAWRSEASLQVVHPIPVTGEGTQCTQGTLQRSLWQKGHRDPDLGRRRKVGKWGNSGEGGGPSHTWSSFPQLLTRGQHPGLLKLGVVTGPLAQRQGKESHTICAKGEPRASPSPTCGATQGHLFKERTDPLARRSRRTQQPYLSISSGQDRIFFPVLWLSTLKVLVPKNKGQVSNGL